MRFLKQSTQVKVAVGPFVDATDGFTLETSISFATTEANLFKHDASGVTDIGTNTWTSHLGGGYYNVTLTASNTDTLGMMVLEAHDTAARPVRIDFMVLPANVWDSLFGTDKLDVNVTLLGENAIAGFLNGTTAVNADVIKVDGSSTAAVNISDAGEGIVRGTVSSGSTLTVVKSNLTANIGDTYNGRVLTFITGTMAGTSTTITDYSGTSHDCTVTALPQAPSSGDTFVIT